jgi:hypothetical protein
VSFYRRKPTGGAKLVISDVYQAANERNVTIVGGAARSVGAAGGWVQGGGHSPLGALYGMGVDSKSRLHTYFARAKS